MLGFLFVVSIMVIVGWLAGKAGTRQMTRMDQRGIWTYKNETYLKWEHVLMTWIKTIEDGDSSRNYFILHYYDEKYKDFAYIEISISRLATTPEKLAWLVESFKKENKNSYYHFDDSTYTFT